MRMRCDLHLNGENRKLILVPEYEETLEHLALKLSAFLLFWAEDPKISPSPKHPALSMQEFRPDLMALNLSGEVSLWVECGTVTLHKLNKLVRRYPSARLVVLKSSERDGRRLRDDLAAQVEKHERVEIWAWPQEAFAEWLRALGETVDVVGEASGRSLNLVLNETPVVADLKTF